MTTFRDNLEWCPTCTPDNCAGCGWQQRIHDLEAENAELKQQLQAYEHEYKTVAPSQKTHTCDIPGCAPCGNPPSDRYSGYFTEDDDVDIDP